MSGLAADEQAFAGGGTCVECHAAEVKAWINSDHSWALREPSAESVLGDFSGVTFTNKAVTSRFYMRDGKYFVETDGADGKLQEFAVRYTVGVRPLQQYLVETEKGRLQALDIAWDVGKRQWFHLYPDQDVAAGNGLHWTGSYKNWQARCAQCHQTGFEKDFDPNTQSYKSRWTDLTVTCEACHGPSSAHVAWARQAKDTGSSAGKPPMIKMGLGQQSNELAVCGPCHSRREAFSQNNAPVGGAFGDHFNLAHLDNGLYFADGQQDAEVYILGSFMQSKMASKGVTCSNCHEPHGGGLVATGNGLCTQCHNETGRSEFPTLKLKNYDSPAHHHHKDGSAAAQCVNCHMPERTYMSIDQRRDHFFRIPDPLQSKAAGAPDVCMGCHKEKSPEWAAQRIGEWSPNIDRSWQDRAPFIAFRNGDQSPKILQALVAYMSDTKNPAIVRATGLDGLRDATNTHLKEGLATFLGDDSDLVRGAAAGLTRKMPAPEKIELLKPLLTDQRRNVRQAAALELAGSNGAGMSQVDFAALQKALAEYQASRAANADMPETYLALAGLALSMKDWPAAEAAFNQAVTMDPQLDTGWVMLARLRSALGDEPGAAQYLEKALGYQPHSANLMFELADLESRRGDNKKAIDWYRQIVVSDPSRIDAWLAMASTALRVGDSATALDATAKILTLEPQNVDALVTKAIAHYARGEMDQAKQNAARAKQILPSMQLPKELEALVGSGQ